MPRRAIVNFRLEPYFCEELPNLGTKQLWGCCSFVLSGITSRGDERVFPSGMYTRVQHLRRNTAGHVDQQSQGNAEPLPGWSERRPFVGNYTPIYNADLTNSWVRALGLPNGWPWLLSLSPQLPPAQTRTCTWKQVSQLSLRPYGLWAFGLDSDSQGSYP